MSLEFGDEDRAARAFSDALICLADADLRLPLLWVPPHTRDRLVALLAPRSRDVPPGLLDGIPEVGVSARTVAPLSRAEQRLLKSLLTTPRVGDTAAALHLSVHTVRHHLKQSYRKLGVNTRAEALALAHELGML